MKIAKFECRECGYEWTTSFANSWPLEEMTDCCEKCQEQLEIISNKAKFILIDGDKID